MPRGGRGRLRSRPTVSIVASEGRHQPMTPPTSTQARAGSATLLARWVRAVPAGVARLWRRHGVVGVVLVGLLALALALRLHGVTSGLPYNFLNPDEGTIVPKAFNVARGHLNPQFFFYPSLYFYLLAAVYLAGDAGDVAAGSRQPARRGLARGRPGALLPAGTPRLGGFRHGVRLPRLPPRAARLRRHRGSASRPSSSPSSRCTSSTRTSP